MKVLRFVMVWLGGVLGLVGLVVFLGLVGVGCQSEGAFRPVNTMRYDLENREVFVLLDRVVRRGVTTSGIQERVLPDGRLEVAVNLRNRLRERLEVQVSCVFKDEGGFSTGDETAWRSVVLSEAAQEGVVFVSMNDRARRYTVRVRQVR